MKTDAALYWWPLPINIDVDSVWFSPGVTYSDNSYVTLQQFDVGVYNISDGITDTLHCSANQYGSVLETSSNTLLYPSTTAQNG